MSKNDPLRFSGRGFDKGDFTDDERAEMRERSKHYDDHFLDSDTFLKEAGLSWIASVAKGFPAFVRAMAVVVTVGGGVAVLRSMGFL